MPKHPGRLTTDSGFKGKVRTRIDTNFSLALNTPLCWFTHRKWRWRSSQRLSGSRRSWALAASLIRSGSNQSHHRSRIKTEEKAKVVAAVWGEEFIQFLAALAVLPWTILNNRMIGTRII